MKIILVLAIQIYIANHKLYFRTMVATADSDYMPFFQTIGIPSMDLRYSYAKVAPKLIISCLS